MFTIYSTMTIGFSYISFWATEYDIEKRTYPWFVVLFTCFIILLFVVVFDIEGIFFFEVISFFEVIKIFEAILIFVKVFLFEFIPILACLILYSVLKLQHTSRFSFCGLTIADKVDYAYFPWVA